MAACSDAGTDPGTSVAIKFGTAGSAASPSSAASFSVAGGQAGDVAGHIVGSKGELNLTNGVLGTPVAFETYFDADIEVEMDLLPVLTIADGVASRDLTILLQPAAWFLRADGTVWDLKALEGELIDFDLEIDDGFDLEID